MSPATQSGAMEARSDAPAVTPPEAAGATSKLRWTDAERAELIALIAQRLTYREIGERLGRSHGSVARYAWRTGLDGPGKAWTAAEIETLRKQTCAGFSYPEIAAQLGRSANAVRIKANELGITMPWELRREAHRRAQLAASKRPEVKARKSAAMRRRWANPEQRETLLASARASIAKHGHWRACHTPEAIAKKRLGDARRVARHFAWIPARYQDELIPVYRALVHTKGLKAAEARVVVTAEIDRMQRRDASAPKARPSFEEQLERVRNGAKVETRFIPAANDYEFSLIGSALA